MQTYGLKRFLVAPVAALAVGATLLLTPHTASADQRDFTLRNASGTTIRSWYVERTAVSSGRPDLLGNEVLRPGALWMVRLNVNPTWGSCRFDMRIVTMDGSSVQQLDVDLCSITTVTYYEGEEGAGLRLEP